MGSDKDFISTANSDNKLTNINNAIYKKFIECKIPPMIVAKPAYSLAQMYMQSLDYLAKTNELLTLSDTVEFAEKTLEVREAVKSLHHFSDQFGRNYYVLMDKLNALTEEWLDQPDEDIDDSSVDEVLETLSTDDLANSLQDELAAHARQQFSTLVKTLISKGCTEDIANFFTENMFELRYEASNLISMVDRLITLSGDYDSMVFDLEEIMIEISIPWVGFSPGETAHALWHIGNHDEDNFFFMGFLGWSLAVLENLQENLENL